MVLVLRLELLRLELRLLRIAIDTAYFYAANGSVKVILRMELLLQLGLVRIQKIIIGLVDLCLVEIRLALLHEGTIRSHDIIHTKTILTAKGSGLKLILLLELRGMLVQLLIHMSYGIDQELLQILDLPVDLVGMKESLEKEEVLLFEHFLRTQETEEHIALAWNLGVFV